MPIFEPCLDDFFGLDCSIPFRRIGADPERKQLRPVPGRVLAVLAVGSVEILWVELKGTRGHVWLLTKAGGWCRGCRRPRADARQ